MRSDSKINTKSPSHLHLGPQFPGNVVEYALTKLDSLLVSSAPMKPLISSLTISPKHNLFMMLAVCSINHLEMGWSIGSLTFNLLMSDRKVLNKSSTACTLLSILPFD